MGEDDPLGGPGPAGSPRCAAAGSGRAPTFPTQSSWMTGTPLWSSARLAMGCATTSSRTCPSVVPSVEIRGVWQCKRARLSVPGVSDMATQDGVSSTMEKSTKVVLSQVNEPSAVERRVRMVRRIRRSSELEGARSTAATREDQDAYARGAITVTELGARVRQRYGVQ